MKKLLIIKNNKNEIFLILLFAVIGVLTRTIFHVASNVEFVTSLSITAGYFFKNKKLSFLVPFLILLVSDLIIGNSLIFLFTWSAYLMAPLFSFVAKFVSSKIKVLDMPKNLLISSEISGVLFTLFFFFWTNAGVVMVSSMYTKDMLGLFESYINGLPFLLNQLLGNIILMPIIFMSTYLYYNYKNYGFKIRRLKLFKIL